MRYVGKDFPLQDPTETTELSFDFSRHPEWRLWDRILTATVAISVVDGTDASSANRLDGAPTICQPFIIQTFANPVDGVKYKLEATVVTASGQTLGLYSNITGQA
jgi:hypothetical protein